MIIFPLPYSGDFELEPLVNDMATMHATSEPGVRSHIQKEFDIWAEKLCLWEWNIFRLSSRMTKEIAP